MKHPLPETCTFDGVKWERCAQAMVSRLGPFELSVRPKQPELGLDSPEWSGAVCLLGRPGHDEVAFLPFTPAEGRSFHDACMKTHAALHVWINCTASMVRNRTPYSAR